jgi:NTE family protein
MPTIFTPVLDGKSQLLDGGILNPLPLNVITKEPGDLVVAVNLNAFIPRNNIHRVENTGRAAYQKMLDTFRTQILKADSIPEEYVERLGFFDLMTKSFDLTQDRLTALTLDIYKPDIVVNICRDSCGIFEFYRANEIIECGRRAFREAVSD